MVIYLSSGWANFGRIFSPILPSGDTNRRIVNAGINKTVSCLFCLTTPVLAGADGSGQFGYISALSHRLLQYDGNSYQ
tara:strand:- start:13 stop:246 length:234 start_codon:yes stop_codon:yes gene_type:complete